MAAEFHLQQETLFLAVSLLDCFLSHATVRTARREPPLSPLSSLPATAKLLLLTLAGGRTNLAKVAQDSKRYSIGRQLLARILS